MANGQNDVGVQIFENQNSLNNWIGFELLGTSVAPDAFGSRIQVSTINGVKIDEKTCGSSYSSQSSHRIYFGLGQGQVEDIYITWPDGSVDYFADLAINQIHEIQQGINPLSVVDLSYNFELFPNPFEEDFVLSLEDNTVTSIEILRTNGSQVFSEKIISNNQLIRTPPEMATGIYLIRLMNENEVLGTRYILKK